MKHFILIQCSILILWSCSKKTDDTISENPNNAIIDYSTKYSTYQNIVFSKPIQISNIHQESIIVLESNGKKYLVSSYSDLWGTTYDFFRSFSIDTLSGLLQENTSILLGGYYESGFPKSPFWYEDLNGDNLKDLFIVDHGKETPSLMVDGKFPGFICHFFVGTTNGTFTKGSIDDVTTIKRYYHNSGIGDVNGDGTKDLVVQAFSTEEMILFLNSGGGITKSNITINNQTGSVWIGDIDGDNKSEIISAPYIDRGTTPSTYIKKIKINETNNTIINLSPINPFGDGYGCYKVFSLKNPKETSKINLFYFVENGSGGNKIFRSKDDDITQLEEIGKTGIRDYQIIDLNFDGINDIFFYVNSGQNLNSRVWLNKGDNTFESPNWDIDLTLVDTFIPLSQNKSAGRTKFLYYGWNGITSATRIVDVYTKKK